MVNEILRPYTIVIFDFDGTLVDVYENHDGIISDFKRCMERHYESSLKYKKISEFYNFLLSPKFKSELENIIYTNEIDCGYELIDCVMRHIPNIRNKYVAILSNNHSSTISRILLNSGHYKYFDVIVGLDKVHYPKPEPDGVNFILSRYSYDTFAIENSIHINTSSDIIKRSIILIGDKKIDEDTAKNCGIEFMYVQDFVKKLEEND